MQRRNVIIIAVITILLVLIVVASFAPQIEPPAVEPLSDTIGPCLSCTDEPVPSVTVRPTLPGDETPTPTNTPTARPTLPGDATDTPTPRATP